MAKELAKQAAINAQLAKASTPEEAMKVASVFKGVGDIAKCAQEDIKKNRDDGLPYMEGYIEAKCKAGDLLGEASKGRQNAPRDEKGRMVHGGTDATLDKYTVRRCRKAAFHTTAELRGRYYAAIKGRTVDWPSFAEVLEMAKLGDKPSRTLLKLIETGKELRFSDALIEIKDRLRQKERDRLAKIGASLDDESTGVYHMSFQECAAQHIEDDSVTLIFTDPPYDKKSVPLFADLAEVAARVLVPGGSLITFLGQHALPEVMDHLTRHLKFYWPLCCLHTGSSAMYGPYGIRIGWKPMLWFVKGKNRIDPKAVVTDLVTSEPQKDAHDWQQSTIEAEYYISNLTAENQLIFDPFCGGGTTAYVAKSIGRRWITCDIDERSANIAKGRIGA